MDKPNKNTQPGPKPGGGKGNKPKFNIYWIYGLIIIAIIAITYMPFGSSPEETDIGMFKEMLRNGDVERLVVVKNTGEVRVTLSQEALEKEQHEEVPKDTYGTEKEKVVHYTFTIGDLAEFEKTMKEELQELPDENKPIIKYEEEKNIFGDILGFLIPIIIIVVIWLFLFRRMSGGGGGQIFNIGKSKAQLFDKATSVKVDFKDVAGLEEAKVEIMEIVDFLKKPKKYTQLGGKIPKGALLVGPPGTGKTLLAKAVAGEANVPFFSMSGSDFVEMFVGVGASRVRDLFKQAKEKSPCIVFIDEIDAIGRARGRNASFNSNDERENTLNQLLTEMDGFATNSGVIILAATNRADVLDRALLRAGRFDRQIHVELPDLKERVEIFKVHMKPLKVSDELDVEFLAKQTPGFSGADIANVCNESALIAARKDSKVVGKQDFLDAIDRIIGGLEKRSKIISQKEKRTIAFHEAGHATVSWLLEHANPLVKVTIIPRGKALGAAWYLPEERQLTTREQMLDEMCSALGGRASEEINFGEVSTGALNDLERVTKQAYAMVTYFGMSDKVGHLSYYDSSGRQEYNFNKPYSEQTGELIDKEAKKILEDQYKRAIDLLKNNKDGLNKLGEKLLEKEVIFSEDLEEIFGKREFNTPENPKAEIKGD